MTFLSDLTVFVISNGEDTLDDCLVSLNAQNCNFNIEHITGVTPMSAAFQAMPDRCKTPYFLQVDADMILQPTTVRLLYQQTKQSPFWIYRGSAPLYEEGFGVGGAVKCWKRNIFRFVSFRDVRTVDRDLHRRLRWLGLTIAHQKEVAGIHRPRHSIFSIYLKTKSDIEKWRYLRRDPNMYALPLIERILSEHPFSPRRLLGAMLGALTGVERLLASKNLAYESQLYRDLLSLLGDESFPSDVARYNLNRQHLLSTFTTAYSNFRSREAEPRTTLAYLVGELFGIAQCEITYFADKLTNLLDQHHPS